MNTEERKTIEFIKILRALAVVLVVWDHLGCLWPKNSNISWWGLSISEFVLGRPLHIIEYFGIYAVALFFMISGFIITYSLQKETRWQFLVKRVFRIFPPLVISTAVFYVINRILNLIGFHSWWMQYNWKEWILGGTLTNYLFNWPDQISGVTWTLFIEVIFYIIAFCLLDWLKKYPKLSISIIMCISFYLTNIPKLMGNVTIFVQSCAYLPLIIFGQICYYYWTKRISGKECIIFSMLDYFVWNYNMYQVLNYHYEGEFCYGPSIIYAVITFVVFMLSESRKKQSIIKRNSGLDKVVQKISSLSYSIYLTHMTYGALMLTLLNLMHVPFSLNLLIALIAVAGVSYLLNRYVETPFIAMGKKILKISWVKKKNTI